VPPTGQMPLRSLRSRSHLASPVGRRNFGLWVGPAATRGHKLLDGRGLSVSARLRTNARRSNRMRLKVRRAKLDDDLRDLFEQYGEQVVAIALALGSNQGTGFRTHAVAATHAMSVVHANQDAAARWLLERRRSGGGRVSASILAKVEPSALELATAAFMGDSQSVVGPFPDLSSLTKRFCPEFGNTFNLPSSFGSRQLREVTAQGPAARHR
jgi:hypothetical protein